MNAISKNQLKSWADLFVKIYISVVLLYQTLWQIVPVRVVMCNAHLDIISPAMAVLGFAFLAADILIERTVIKSRYCVLLVATIVIMCASSLFYVSYGWTENAKVIVWQVVHMFLIYSFYLRLAKEHMERFLRNLFLVISAIFTVAVVVSIYQFIMQISYITPVEGGNSRQGFQGGRLFGVFGYLYYATLLALLLGVGAVYGAVKAKRIWVRILFIIQAALFFIYLVLSGTRSTLVGLLCGMAVFTIIAVRNIIANKKTGASKVVRGLGAVAAAVLCVVILYGAYSGTHMVLSKVPVLLGTQDSDNSGNANDSDNDDITGTIIDDVLERPDTQTGDISNNRFRIWRDYFLCGGSSVKTMLFGFSPSYMSIIKEQFPDIYIVQYSKEHYPLSYEIGRIYDTHNGYLAIYSSIGLLGFVTMAAFLICVLITAIKYFVKNKRPDSMAILIFTMLSIIAVTTFFDSDIFFKCTSASIIFWLLIGCMMKYAQPLQNSSDNAFNEKALSKRVEQSEETLPQV